MVGHSESDIAAAAHAAYQKWQTWGVQHAHNALAPIKADILVATGDNARAMEGSYSVRHTRPSVPLAYP